LLGRAIGTQDAAVLAALGKIQDEEKELYAQENTYRTRLRGETKWPHRPVMSSFCGLEENNGVYYVAQIRNREFGCKSFEKKRAAPRACANCVHRAVADRFTDDVNREQTWGFMVAAKAASGASASMIENLWKQHLESSASLRAYEIRSAYQHKGAMPEKPNYLDYCKHLSGDGRFVLCALQNPYATCQFWESESSTQPVAAQGFSASALFDPGSVPSLDPQEALIEEFADFAGCILGATLSEGQLTSLHASGIEALSDESTAAQIRQDVASFQAVRRAAVPARNLWRQQNQAEYLQTLRTRKDVISQLLLRWYGEAQRVLVGGMPPLTREAAESWVELEAFFAAISEGREPSPPAPQALEQAITRLVRSYPGMPAARRASIRHSPIGLLELKRAWPGLTPDERENVRTQLAATLGSPAQAPAAETAGRTNSGTAQLRPRAAPARAGESTLQRLRRELDEAQDPESKAKLHVQIQIEMQNEQARIELDNSIRQMYGKLSEKIIDNIK
jgi:hypothetical protein